jgi:hypothetical protein
MRGQMTENSLVPLFKMSKVKETYYDQPKDSAWFMRFDVLLLKNSDHRKILNRQPEVKICHGCKWECVKTKVDFNVLSN